MEHWSSGRGIKMKQGSNSDSGVRAPQYFEVANSQGSSLPFQATTSDVRDAVRLLKREPEGITASQATEAYCKRIFEPRKVSAYAYWGIVSRDGDRLKLTSLGWEIASRMAPEVEAYRAVLEATMPYHGALVWTMEERLEVVTHLEIGAFWKEQYPDTVTGFDEEKIRSSAASFFHICHAAEIGMLTVGRKGYPTQLFVYDEELRTYLGKSTGQVH